MKYITYQPDNASVQNELTEDDLGAYCQDAASEGRDAFFWHNDSLSPSQVLERLEDIKLLVKRQFQLK